LIRLKSFFGGVGNILVDKRGYVTIPHFDKYPLITQKSADFKLFKMIHPGAAERPGWA
jgi:hypothetical protein